MTPPPPFFWGETPEDQFYKSQNIRNSKSFYQTPNGKIFTQSWLPLDPTHPIKATVFMTHGYGSDTSWCFQKICIEFAKWGYAVFAADLLGHGRSEGLHGYLGDMDKVAATSLEYFVSVRRSEEYCKLPAFLFGESMGGMITMLMYFQSEPDSWTGLIFSALGRPEKSSLSWCSTSVRRTGAPRNHPSCTDATEVQHPSITEMKSRRWPSADGMHLSSAGGGGGDWYSSGPLSATVAYIEADRDKNAKNQTFCGHIENHQKQLFLIVAIFIV